MHGASGLEAVLGIWRRLTSLAVVVAAATLVGTVAAALSRPSGLRSVPGPGTGASEPAAVAADAAPRPATQPGGTGQEVASPPPMLRRFDFFAGLEPRPVSEAAASLTVPDGQVAEYSAEIDEAATRYGVPRRLVEAVIRVESGFKALAISNTGARGLMQLMPGTAAALGVRDAFDPRENIEGGVRHLRGLINRYSNDLRLALAAYNAGEQAVNTYGGVPPYRETRLYVERVLVAYGAASPSPRSAGPAGVPALLAAR
jgi:soluble lytic murein transglycosylase-like protein